MDWEEAFSMVLEMGALVFLFWFQFRCSRCTPLPDFVPLLGIGCFALIIVSLFPSSKFFSVLLYQFAFVSIMSVLRRVTVTADRIADGHAIAGLGLLLGFLGLIGEVFQVFVIWYY